MDGVLNVNKPAGLSSARVVSTIKRLLPRKTKVGHAGTLDPFATGVLVVLIGRATRSAEWFMHQPKQYEATIKLGATTPTLDPDSQETPTLGASPPAVDCIQRSLAAMVGEIEQLPPAFSALKISGRPAYRLARAGQDVSLKPRVVRIDAIEVLGCDWPLVRIRVDCGRGTYIRSIARDLGAALGMGGYLTELTRTRVGPCLLAKSVELSRLQAEGVQGAVMQEWASG